jgi:sulfate adenylyltransferase large subunit
MAASVPLELRSELDLFLEREMHKELLRFTTAGSVDDGKSTLIGRLLHDCKAVYEDQLDSVKKSRVNRSGRGIDFSLLTDGLRAEREQGITIDVAYRYFSTVRRKFIIADTPGHEQYTRNMATGASNADLAVILIDASKGLLSQTRRHTYIAALLGIDNVLAAVNKMDLLGYREDVFRKLEQEFLQLAQILGISAVQCVPISALDGDNVVVRSEKTSWYRGPTLLEHLESVPIRVRREMQELRLPVQLVIRPDASFRGFAGRVASGRLRPGDELLVLPSRQKTRVASLASFDGPLELACAGQSVVLKPADDIDVSRGDLFVSPDSEPYVSDRFSAMVVWLHATPLELNHTYIAKHLGRQVKARPTQIRYRVDVNQLTEHPADHLEMNEIALVEFATSQPLYFDPYRTNRTTGSLILIDPFTNATLGAVMIHESLGDVRETARNADAYVIPRSGQVTLEDRTQRRGHRPAVFVVDGRRASAEALERGLFEQGFDAVLVDCNHIAVAEWQALSDALLKAGLLVIAWHADGLTSQQKSYLADRPGSSFFDLSDGRGEHRDREPAALLAAAGLIAETLRVRKKADWHAEN